MDSEVVQDPLSVSAPQANAYEFQAGGIVDMIAKLEDKFKDERNSLEKDEMQAKFAFEKVVQDLVSSIKKATKQRGRDAATKSEREQAAAEAKGDLAETTQSRDEDTTYLNDLTAQCASKSNDFAARQQLRAEELEAITKAVEILASGSVTGMSEKHLPQFLQKSFALRASATLSPVQRNVAAFLQDRAAKLQSRVLSMVAAKVTEDPFVKVKKMIKDLIVRLMEEANEESEHKGWCDQELSTNKQTRDTKSSQVEELTSTKDALTAEIAKLMEEAADLTAAIASIDAAVAEATAQRQAESAKNKETIKDAQEAQTAVSQAVAVLKEFYAKAATATALVQQPEVDAPETFDKAYKGMGGESGGVLGMLEVIQSDFSRLEVETTAEEEEGSDAFERFSAESDKDKSVKNKTLQHKINTKASKNGDLMDCVKDLKATQEELDAALAYFDKLKPNCVDAGVSYADRVQRREDEIESLQEALRILEGQDIA
jgi:chromosome segregation ATPase